MFSYAKTARQKSGPTPKKFSKEKSNAENAKKEHSDP